MSKKAKKAPKGALAAVDRRQQLAERAVRTPAPPAAPAVGPWTRDAAGRVEAVREAEHWHRLPGKHIHCTLCYRLCDIGEGEAGFCRYRRNEGGTLRIPEHGTLTRFSRQRLGYGGGQRTYAPGALGLGIGAVRCTAACSFCCSDNVVWRPERLPWLGGRERGPGIGGTGWFRSKALVHPSGAVSTARQWGATHLVFAENEPLLSFEYTLDVARLAKADGRKVVLYTNGFATPEVIRWIAPYVDAVDVGLKGSLAPAFYAKWMRSPGGEEAVKAALKEWRRAGVYVYISDLVPPAHQIGDDALAEAQRRAYAWIAEELGEHTPLLHGHMHPPDHDGSKAGQLLVPPTPAAYAAYWARYHESHERAQAAGLHYAHRAYAAERLTCHHCGGLLLQLHQPPACAFEPCRLYSHYCDCWSHTQHVTDGKCDHCGAAVPIVTLSREELAEARGRATEAAAAAAD